MKFVSLCKRGANRLATVYKSDGDSELRGSLEMRCRVIKEEMAERGELIAVVYAPDLVDSQGDFANAEAIKEMAYEAMQKGFELDIRHNEEALPREDVYVAESFIIQKDDPRFADQTDYDGNSVDVTGGWGVVIKIASEDLRKQYRDGEWNGVSFGGMAELEEVSKSDQTSQVIAKFKERKAMSPEEIKKAIDEANAPIVATLTKLAEALSKGSEEEAKKQAEEEAARKAQEEKGIDFDPCDAEAVRKHLAALKRDELKKSIDWSDPKAVEEYAAELQKQVDDTPGNSNQGDRVHKNENDEAAAAMLAILKEEQGG